MKRAIQRRRGLYGVLATFAVICVVVPLVASHIAAAAPSGRAVLHGHLVPALKNQRALGDTDGSQMLTIEVSLTPRDPRGLQDLVHQQSDKKTQFYHHYLSPQQYLQRFGPTQASVDAVKAFLSGQGLAVASVAPNHLFVKATGTVATVESAFQVHLSDYRFDGRTVYAPTNEPSVPAELAPAISGIAGLDNVARMRSYATLAAAPPVQHGAALPNLGPAGGYTPTDLRTAYDMGTLMGKTHGDGTGQTLALFELAGYNVADVNQYRSYYSLGAGTFNNVLVDGASATASTGASEVELDMEVVSAIAPGAAQAIYIGPNTGTGVLDTYNRIVTDNTAAVVSTSWGTCEANAGTSFLQAEDNIFQQAASQGQSVFAAAGDSGAYDCQTTSLAVDSPASDPYVTGVGGTSLTLGASSVYSSETAWACPTCTGRGPNGAGGGGGLSTFFTQPGYQFGAGVSNTYSNGNREVPDVSADADPNTGYSIYCTYTYDGCPSTGWLVAGGTSAAAPLWAAAITDLNGVTSYLKIGGRLGTANDALYYAFNIPNGHHPYHDIPTGSNNLYYPTTTGYDLATGIGSPDVWELAQAIFPPYLWMDAYNPTLGADQNFAIMATTQPGASPAAQTVYVINYGITNAQYSASLPGGVTWASLSGTTSGTLTPGLAASFTISFSTPSTTPQTYSTTMTISDPSAAAVNAPLAVPVTVVAPNVSKVWYFAEGYTASGFDTFLTIANPYPTTANVSVKYLLLTGSPVTKTYTVNGNARYTIHVNNESLSDPSVSMVVTSDQPVVVERPMYFTAYFPTYTVPGGTDTFGATSLSQDFSFGYLDTTTHHDTYLTILNPNNTAMTVTTDYSPAAGGTVIETTNPVAANARGTIHVNVDHGLAAGVYSARVHLSIPGLVERPLYFIDSVTGNTGAADVIGVPAPQTNWYFAEGYTDPTFSERYLLSNPCLAPGNGGCAATTTAHVTVQFMDLNGVTTNQSVTLTAGQQQVVNVNSLLGNYASNSATVTSDQPMLAERLMSFRYTGQTGPLQPGANYPGATDVLGAAAPTHLLYFAEGYTDYNFAEYLTLQNPDPSNGTWVSITFLPLVGSPVTIATYVGPHTRATVFTNQVVTGYINTSFSLQVESTLPIVVERPMYFSAYGTEPGATDVVGYQPQGS